jgi:hypothetical protein
MTIFIQYHRVPVATVGATRCFLAPQIEALPDGDPMLRFVVFMCTYALDIQNGRLPGPYSDERAAFFARSALIDDDDLNALADLSDDEVAERLQVPVEQVHAKRRDLAG